MLTRAKSLEIIIGHEDTLYENKTWEAIILQSREMGSFYDEQNPFFT